MTSFVQPAKFSPPANSRTDSLLDCAIARAEGGSQVVLTVRPLPVEGLMEMFGRLAAALNELEATIVHLMVFGNVSAGAAGTEAMRRIFGHVDWPVTWLEGSAGDGSPIAGIQAFAFTGGAVRRLRQNGRVVGSVFEDGTFRHCMLGGLGPNQNSSSRPDQTKQTLDNLAEALAQGGFAFADVMRTWFYLEDLLSWYGEFNQVRTRAYSAIKFRTGSLPASTGIGARNTAAAALAVGAWAAQPLSAAGRIAEVASPLQCPAPAYGSSFSRAMEVSSPEGCGLYVSGTASISPDGRTLWIEDVRQQVAQTMRVVEAILHSRGLELSDLTRATAYFKRRADFGAFTEWCAERNGLSLPVVPANCDVCRDDLLFEIELDAWRAKAAVNRQ
jgi:enamine deaminase RidA (YjgF/YER057c/UK114 family)